jgi:hypothetical protein
MAIVIELVIGGGRLISFGPVSLRMILFILALIVTLAHILKGKQIEADYIKLIIAFTGMLGIGSLIGFISGADKKLIWEDLKPLLFFYLLPFLSLAITGKNETRMIKKIIVSASTMVAGVFIILVGLITIDVIPFLDFYKITSQTSEFFYRGEYSFYYKGFVYLCIAFIFVHLVYNKKYGWILALLSIAILITFTRGLIFALSLTYFTYFILIKKYVHVFAMLTLGVIVLLSGKDIYSSISESLYKLKKEKQTSINPALSSKLLGDREFSDNERKRQIQQVFSSTTVTAVFWGHGFGNGVKSRPVHMEISYLEIFHKQGLIGIGVWIFLFLSLVKSFARALSVKPQLAYAYFLSALFIFLQSLTNQYINNPIGLGMVLLALVCLDRIIKSPNPDDISSNPNL